MVSWPEGVSSRLFVKAVLGWGLAVGLIIWALFTLASVTSSYLGLPATLGIPFVVRALGAVLLVGGLGLALWLVRFRNPVEMIVSTYLTFAKMFAPSSMSNSKGRTEPLVIAGPLKYVRNPLYLGAITAFIGWGLFTGITTSLLGAVFVLAWFRFVQIPFEERELRAIFGEQFVQYSSEVPMLVPFTKRKRN